MKYKSIKFNKFVVSRKYGIELETSGEMSKTQIQAHLKNISHRNSFVSKYELTHESDCWHIKDDATSGPQGRNGPKGVEIASFVGSKISHLDHMSNVASKLAAVGCKTNDNCGFHIHAEANDIKQQQMGVILGHWIKVEKILSMALPERRRDNYYCKPILERCKAGQIIRDSADNFWSAKQIWYLLKPKNLGYFDNNDRKVTLNIVNYVRAQVYDLDKRNTIELRCPEGTLAKDDILGWVVIFLSFIENTKNKQMPSNLLDCDLIEVLKLFNLYHENSNFYIYDPYLHKTRIWFLNRIIQYGNEKKVINKAEKILEVIEKIK